MYFYVKLLSFLNLFIKLCHKMDKINIVLYDLPCILPEPGKQDFHSQFTTVTVKQSSNKRCKY